MFRHLGAVNALAFTLPGLLAWTLTPDRTPTEARLHPRSE